MTYLIQVEMQEDVEENRAPAFLCEAGQPLEWEDLDAATRTVDKLREGNRSFELFEAYDSPQTIVGIKIFRLEEVVPSP